MKAVFLSFLIGLAAFDGDDPKTIEWDDLMPDGEYALLEKMMEEQGSSLPLGHGPGMEIGEVPGQIGTFNTVADLDGKLVRLPGFIVPLDYASDGKVTSFLLVPYQGACIHEPPPPPNQIVFVDSETPQDFGAMWRPVWITGEMRVAAFYNSIGNSAYSMKLTKWEPYGE